MAERNRPHIVVSRAPSVEGYTRPPRRIESKQLGIPADRHGHGARLANELEAAGEAALERREQLPGDAPAASGIYVTFTSFQDVELALQSLDPRQGKRHPELVAVRRVMTDDGVQEQATVYVPDGKLGYFLKKLQDYADTADADKPKNRNLVDRIAAIGVSSLRELWTDPDGDFPQPQQRVWWELWLRRHDGQERTRVERFAEQVAAAVGRLTLAFTDRVVVLVEATAEQLATALDVLDDLAELRRPSQPAALLALEPPTEQADWVEDLAERTQPAGENAPAACVLDTGTYQAHPLLAASLSVDDCHTCDPAWTEHDHDGHGTEMAGLALFGRLEGPILDGQPVRLIHRLESVKILPPPPGQNPPELYGALTATAASLVEIQRPNRARVFSLAVTASGATATEEGDVQFGQPTSWSASIDALAAGLEIDTADEGLLFLNEDEIAERRLFLISAGNVDTWDENHLDRSDVEPLEDPAQAWNALCIGAYTELTDAAGSPGFDGWTAVAPRGELSPFSRTGVAVPRD